MGEMTVQQAFDQAMAHHREGRLREAEGLYRAILQQHPNHGDALRLLGVLANQVGRGELGLELIRRAVAVDPGSSTGYAALGQVLAGLGRLEESAGAYARARAIDPGSADLCNDMGNVLLALDRVDDAIALYRQAVAIQADHPEGLNNLGTGLMRQEKFAEAVGVIQGALKARPDFVEARCNLGVALQRCGRLDEAMGVFRESVSRWPEHVDTAIHLVDVYQEMGRLDDALALAEQTARANPNSAMAHNALGIVRMTRKEQEPAMESYRRALSLSSSFAEARYNLGTALYESFREEEALVELTEALRLVPRMVQAWNNLGSVYMNLGRYPECEATQRQAIAIRPTQESAHLNLGVALLVQGKLAEGFQEFEWRWRVPELSLSKRKFAQPRWNGEELGGKTILLHGEQGFGDTIQFARYIPQVIERGGRVILGCQSEVARLIHGMPGVAQIVTEKDRLPGGFDVHCALMSLPLVLGTTLETIPSLVPYIQPGADGRAKWKDRLAGFGDRLKVGLAWAGRPTHAVDRRRTIALAALEPLARTSNAVFISLQKGNGAEQASHPPPGMELIDWTNDLKDFADTAALVENLDLVITVDSANAHLAGALAKPTWVLIPFAPDWRWMLERTDSPWYPTMRLFRQPRLEDWRTPIEQVAAALGQFISR